MTWLGLGESGECRQGWGVLCVISENQGAHHVWYSSADSGPWGPHWSMRARGAVRGLAVLRSVLWSKRCATDTVPCSQSPKNGLLEKHGP